MTAAAIPSGPKGHFLIGNLTQYRRDPLGFVTDCARRYGDIVRVQFLDARGYLLHHPSHIEHVLSTHSRDFIKPGLFRAYFLRRILGGGLLTSDGETWQSSRRLVQPVFHRERINAYGEIIVAYAGRMLTGWREGEIRNIHQEMLRLTMEISAKTLFDADVTNEADAVGTAFEYFYERLAAFNLRWYLDNLLPTPGRRSYDRNAKRLDELVYDFIRRRREAGDTDRGDLLSMLLQARDEDGNSFSDRQLRDEVMTLFLAGHETTALALVWTWYLLAQHEEAERKLHAELDRVLGGRTPTVTDLPQLRYAEMVIKEALRLYPPAWCVGREAARDCEIGGNRVARGEQVYMYQWVTHRDTRFFERPEDFIPERWTNNLEKRLPRFAYFPFGGGPRQCIGNNFAMMEAVLLLATIARKFRLRLVPGQVITLLPSITLRPKNGIKVALEAP